MASLNLFQISLLTLAAFTFAPSSACGEYGVETFDPNDARDIYTNNNDAEDTTTSTSPNAHNAHLKNDRLRHLFRQWKRVASARAAARHDTSRDYTEGDWVDVQLLTSWGKFTGAWQRAQVSAVRLNRLNSPVYDLIDENGTPVVPALPHGIRSWHLRPAESPKDHEPTPTQQQDTEDEATETSEDMDEYDGDADDDGESSEEEAAHAEEQEEEEEEVHHEEEEEDATSVPSTQEMERESGTDQRTARARLLSEILEFRKASLKPATAVKRIVKPVRVVPKVIIKVAQKGSCACKTPAASPPPAQVPTRACPTARCSRCSQASGSPNHHHPAHACQKLQRSAAIPQPPSPRPQTFSKGNWVKVQMLERKHDGEWVSNGKYGLARITGVEGSGMESKYQLVDVHDVPVRPALQTGIRNYHLRRVSAAVQEKMNRKFEQYASVKAAEQQLQAAAIAAKEAAQAAASIAAKKTKQDEAMREAAAKTLKLSTAAQTAKETSTKAMATLQSLREKLQKMKNAEQSQKQHATIPGMP